MMVETNAVIPQPADAQDFLVNCGRFQQWSLLSPDGRVRCAVICRRADSGGKPERALWVSISAGDRNRETNLFEHCYTVSGYFIAWTTRWNSSDDLTIEVFSHYRNPMHNSSDQEQSPTNHLATLEFHRDPQTGKFSDTKR
jgi:hypothetical protein